MTKGLYLQKHSKILSSIHNWCFFKQFFNWSLSLLNVERCLLNSLFKNILKPRKAIFCGELFFHWVVKFIEFERRGREGSSSSSIQTNRRMQFFSLFVIQLSWPWLDSSLNEKNPFNLKSWPREPVGFKARKLTLCLPKPFFHQLPGF